MRHPGDRRPVYRRPESRWRRWVVAADQRALLASSDPQLARNKQLVFDFWRIVYEGGHMERAAEFMTPEYIQHNPNVESGRDAFVGTIGKSRPPRAGAGDLELSPSSTSLAERDIVVVMWARRCAIESTRSRSTK